jgi:c-di-GMP-binding flagellar brake protein YcgR
MMSATVTGIVAERRQYFRLTLEAECEVTVLTINGKPITHPARKGKLVDISGGGVCVMLDMFLPVQRQDIGVELKFSLHGSYWTMKGRVVRRAEGRSGQYQYGIMFIGLQERMRDQLIGTLYHLQAKRRKISV